MIEEDRKCSLIATPEPITVGSEDSTPSPQEGLARLEKGNLRFVNDQLLHPNRSAESREAVKHFQFPFAVILGCSDSRVSPEILFDQGIGDLFVVRVAGNVVGPLELDSIEFAVVNLRASLIVVLGHEGCGAVRAVVEQKTAEIEAIAALIEPAVRASSCNSEPCLERAVKTNVRMRVEQLQESPLISRLTAEGNLKVAGGYYSLQSGTVEWLD